MNTSQSTEGNYALIEGGLFRRVQFKLGIQNHQAILAIAGIGFAWLPLLILTTIEGTLYAEISMPFLHDVPMHARLLIALPLLILVRTPIHTKTTAVTRYIANSLLDAEEQQKLLSLTMPKMRKLACSSLTEFILIFLVVGSVLSLYKSGAYTELLGGTTSWKFENADGVTIMSPAGKWAAFISIPFFQLLLLQWLWRYFIWIVLLFRFSKLPLKLLPTHADRSGGLGILILAQHSFSFIFFAGSLVISGQLIVLMMNSPDEILLIQRVGIGYIILSLMLLLFPLLFFISKLVKTKQLGLLQLSTLGAELSQTFEKDWLNESPFEKRMEERRVDPSMAYDYSGMYDTLQQLRPVTVTLRDIVSIAVTIAIPFLPILFVYFSAAEILQKIIGFLV